uniref:EFHB C-terminal EF-hand domain-containing protein n=1 Tax=Musca domestica TaxID=7370 RepID=A0A1I8N0M1_MUSDO
METKKSPPQKGEPFQGTNDRIGDGLEEAAEYILKAKCRMEIQKARENVAQLNASPVLPEEHVHDLLSPELKKSHFVTFREQFSEDMFFKKPKLGKVYPLQTKPDRFTNENFTYGKESLRSGNLYELILPKKSVEEINREYTDWHEKYIKSHDHYFPAERIRRNYNDKFNPNKTFGICKKTDTSGLMVRECLQQPSGFVLINGAQKRFIDRTVGQLGSRLKSSSGEGVQRSTEYVESKFNSDSSNIRALFENSEHSSEKNTTVEAIGYVKQLRRKLANHKHFHIHDLKVVLEKYDKNKRGFLELSTIFRVMRSLQIRADETLLRRAMLHFQIIEDAERVNLDLFWKMLHVQYPLPTIASNKFENPTTSNNNITVYRSFCRDREKTLPSTILEKRCKDSTTAADCISPSIVVHSGLSNEDFEISRSKEELRKIFCNLLKDNFEDIWNVAISKCEGDNNNKLSINDFMEAIRNGS